MRNVRKYEASQKSLRYVEINNRSKYDSLGASGPDSQASSDNITTEVSLVFVYLY